MNHSRMYPVPRQRIAWLRGVLSALMLASLALAWIPAEHARAQSASATGRADSALTGAAARTASSSSSTATGNPNMHLMSEAERGETYKAMTRLNRRAAQLRLSETDLNVVQRKYDQLQTRSSNGKLPDATRRAAYTRMLDYGKILAMAKEQVVEYKTIRQQAAQLDQQLNQDKALQIREAMIVRPVDQAAQRKKRVRSERYGADPNTPTQPMSSEMRATYEQRFKEWKKRVKQLEAKNPDAAIQANEQANLDLANHLASPVLPPEARLSINAQIAKNQTAIDRTMADSEALWQARRTVYEMDNELIRDDERRLRLQAGGVFSDPRYHPPMPAISRSTGAKSNDAYITSGSTTN